MSLMGRAYANIKQIDLKMVIFVGGFFSLFVFLAIPKDMWGELGSTFRFLFSPGFYPPLENTPGDVTTITTNNIYKLMNVSKIILWVSLVIGIVGLLIKKPSANVPGEKNEI